MASASASRLHRQQDGPHSPLQQLPRSIPVTSTLSSHRRSPSLSRYPKFEDSSVDEKSRVARVSPLKTEASASPASAPESLFARQQHPSSRPSSATSLRHLTSHQNNSSPDLPLSPIPNTTASSQFALPLPSLHSDYIHPPRKIRLWSIIKPWIPVLAYLSTSLGFLVALAFWKAQVFQGAFFQL